MDLVRDLLPEDCARPNRAVKAANGPIHGALSLAHGLDQLLEVIPVPKWLECGVISQALCLQRVFEEPGGKAFIESGDSGGFMLLNQGTRGSGSSCRILGGGC